MDTLLLMTMAIRQKNTITKNNNDLQVQLEKKVSN